MTLIPTIQSFEDFEREVAPIVTPPFKSRFGAIPWRDLEAPGAQHEWLVKNLITRHELCMLAGPSQSGKSFLAIDLAMAVCRGIDWFGRKVRRGGVIYQAGESAKGVRRKRLPAYRKFHDLALEDELPFVMLSSPVDLYAGDDHTNLLIEEIKHWKEQFGATPVELLVVDTYAAATPGADENSAKDMTTVLARAERIRRECEIAVLLVHHMNAAGEKPRGHTSIFANLDSVLICKLVENQTDDDGRKVREMSIGKMKDGEADNVSVKFVLPQVLLGTDSDGDKVTSCVVSPPAREGDAPKVQGDKGLQLSAQQEIFLRAVHSAIKAHGIAAPSGMGFGPHTRIVEWKHIRDEFIAKSFEADPDEPADKRKQRIKTAMRRHGEYLAKWKIIAKDVADGKPWVWVTDRKVRGFGVVEYAGPSESASAKGAQQQQTEIPE